MNPNTEHLTELARKTAGAEYQLQKLEWEIGEIGQPAARDLKRRLDALKVEAHALDRNLAGLLGVGAPDSGRLEKVETLLDHIVAEGAEVEHDADFLMQSPPSTAEYAAKAGSRVVALVVQALHRVVGAHHPLGMSVFVNHSHKTLIDQYGVADGESGTRDDG